MRTRKGIALAIILFAVLGLAYYFSRPAYPKISPQAYACATALYSTCNQQSPQNLDKLSELIDVFRAERTISVPERKWLRAIIDQARSGEWQQAVAECRVLLDCQVDRDLDLKRSAG